MTSTWRRGVLLVGLSAIGWSLAGWFVRLIHTDAVTTAGWRGFFSALAILAYLGARRPGRMLGEFQRMGSAGWAVSLISTISTLAYMSALTRTSVANVSIIHATAPFLAGALAWILLRERPAPATLAACLLALFGVIVMVRGEATIEGLGGMGFALVMTLGMAFLTILSRWHRSVSMVPATCLSALQLALIGLIFAQPFSVSLEDLAVLAVFGVVQAASFAFYIEGARYLTPASSTLIAATDVPLSPLWVWLAFTEIPARATVIGGIIIVGAMLLDVLAGLTRGRGVSPTPDAPR